MSPLRVPHAALTLRCGFRNTLEEDSWPRTSQVGQPQCGHGCCDIVTLSLSRMQAIKNAFSVTLNDLVLTAVAGKCPHVEGLLARAAFFTA